MGKYDRNPEPAPVVTEEPAAEPRRSKYDRAPPPTQAEQAAKEQAGMSWPTWLKQGTSDLIEAGGRMASFGMKPRVDAAVKTLTGEYPDYSAGLAAEQARIAGMRERSPYATLTGDVGGGVAGGIGAGAARLGTNLAARLGGNLPARIFGYGTEGAAVGGAQGAGQTYSGNPEDYVRNTAIGAGTGAVLGGAGGTLVPKSAVQMRPGDPRTRQPIPQPSEAELLARSDRGYRVLSQIPVTYPNQALQAQLRAAETQMATQNVAPEQAQTVFRILNRIRGQTGAISPAQIDGIRQSLNNMKNVPTPGAEKAGVAAAILRDSLDDMIQNGASVASSPQLAAQAAQWVKQARGDRAAMFRSQQLTDPLANATRKAQTKGTPVGEQLVTKGNKLLETRRGEQPNTRGWTNEERALLAEAITPTAAERVSSGFAALPLKTIGAGVGGTAGGVSGGGLGLVGGGLVGSVPGAAGGGLAGSAIGAGIGAGAQRAARGFSAGGVQQRWEDAAAALRGRSPSYERATQGSVPVAGPGMGPKTQGLTGAATAELGTPYADDRDAMAWAALRGLMQ